MLNQCQFIGNLGADPETRTFQNGGQVCNLRLAVTEKWKSKDGERQEKTEWVSVAIFSDGLAKVAAQYLRKGSKVFVSGKLATRKWQDKDGSDRYSTEIVLQGPSAVLTMLDGAPSGGTNAPQEPQRNSRQEPQGGFADDLDDDIPFATNSSVY